MELAALILILAAGKMALLCFSLDFQKDDDFQFQTMLNSGASGQRHQVDEVLKSEIEQAASESRCLASSSS